MQHAVLLGRSAQALNLVAITFLVESQAGMIIDMAVIMGLHDMVRLASMLLFVNQPQQHHKIK